MNRLDRIRNFALAALLILIVGLLLGLWLRNPKRRARGVQVETTAAVVEEVRRIG